MGSAATVATSLVEESCDVTMVLGEGRVKSVNSDAAESERTSRSSHDRGILQSVWF